MELNLKMARFARRLLLLELLDRIAVGVLAAFGLSTLIVGIDRLIYLGADARIIGGALIFVALAWAIIDIAARRRVTRLEAAIKADQMLGLADRLPCAIQMLEHDGPWALAVVNDATQRIRSVTPRSVFPYRAKWPARLLAPAIIVFTLVSLAPSADLLGRMRAEVRRRVAAEAEALSAATALAAATRRLSPNNAVSTDSPRELRLSLARIEKKLLDGLDDSKRADLATDLRRLAALLGEERGGERLAERINSTADAIARNDKDAGRMLRAAQEELARLEEMLKATDALSKEMQEIAEIERSALRHTNASPTASHVKADIAPIDADLVELAASGRELSGTTEPTGIIYSRAEPRTLPTGAEGGHEQALRSALVDIETGRIPSGYARLVRAYFDAIRPAEP